MSEEKLDTQIRREQIAQAALELVASQGLRRLSVAAVARRVGLVPSGIYRHFHSKTKFSMPCWTGSEQRLMENVRAACREHCRSAGMPARRIDAAHPIYSRRPGNSANNLFRRFSRRASRTERKSARAFLANTPDSWPILCAAGKSKASIRGDLDPATVAMMVFGIVLPAGILWHLTEGGFDVTRHAARAWEMLRSAIVPADEKAAIIDIM